MITKFDKPIKTKKQDIDELYDGKYIAFLDTTELFGEGLCYVAAMGEKTDEVFDELYAYIRVLREKEGMHGGVRVGNKNRWEEDLYVIFRDVR